MAATVEVRDLTPSASTGPWSTASNDIGLITMEEESSIDAYEEQAKTDPRPGP